MFKKYSNPHSMLNYLLILCTFLTLTYSSDIIPLSLNRIKPFNLSANVHQNFSLKIKQESKPGQSIFITAQTPFDDPFEQPYMTIKSSQDYLLYCDNQQASYTGICKIPEKQIKLQRQFIIEIYCLVDCQLQIAAYASKMYSLQIGKIVTIASMQKYGLAQLVEIQVPLNATFSSILILAQLQSFQTAKQGFTLLANFGPNTTAPTPEQYQQKAQTTYGHRLSLQITNQQIKAGQSIYLYLFLGQNNTVALSSYIITNQTKTLTIGNPLVDFASSGQKRQYVVQFTDQDRTFIANKDIFVKFIVYSGTPDIKISFDSNFTDINTQDNWFIQSSFAFLITPAQRQSKNFTNKIYIKTTSFFPSSYYLQITVNTKNFVALQNQMMQLVKIPIDGFQNFIYEDQNYLQKIPTDGRVRYKATIQMIHGAIQAGIRDCDSLMKDNNINGCLINTVDQFKDPKIKKTFDNVQGQMRKTYNTYQVFFYYNVTTCPKVSVGSRVQRHICDFHIVIHNLVTLKPKQGFLGIQITKYTQPKILKQSIITRDTVLQQQYNYYKFQLPSINNITKLQFYTTVLEGDIVLLVSKKIQYPQFADIGVDVKLSIIGSKIISGQQLTAGMYYIGVYGYEQTDYTISVAIQRINNNNTNDTDTDVTQIRLQKGISQKYTMQANKTLMKFSLTSYQSQPIILTVNTIKGIITSKLTQKTNPQTTICQNNPPTISNLQCSITTKQDSTYILIVTGLLDQIDIFTIDYQDNNTNNPNNTNNNTYTCQNYPMDIPMYLQIVMGTDGINQCVNFNIKKLQDLQITVAMSDLDKMKARGIIQTSIKSIYNNIQIKLNSYQYIIKKDQLIQLCTNNTDNSNNNDGVINCNLHIVVSQNVTNYNGNKQKIWVLIALQGVDEENVLFDGIPSKITSNKISTTFAKHFYYYVYDVTKAHDLNIYLNSQNQATYQILARVVSDTIYARDLQNLQYPTFNSNLSDTIITNSTVYSSITSLTVPKVRLTQLSLHSSANVVLISIFGISSNNNVYNFRIQATQFSTYLAYGQSKIGYVDNNQLYQYEIQVNKQIPSIINIRSMGQQKCMISYVQVRQFIKQTPEDQGQFIITALQFIRMKIFNQDTGNKKILIRGTSQQLCTYQITYNSLSTPLKTILKNIPYQLKIQTTNGTAYYVYQSTTNQSLTIVQMISSGNSYIYAQPVLTNANENIQSWMNKNIDNYQYKSDINTNLQISKDSNGYCFNCYYLVAVKAVSVVSGQLIVTAQNTAIPLKQGIVTKDKLYQQKTKIYQYYSMTSFNLSFNVIYGEINVIVQNSKNQSITYEGIRSEKQIVVNVNISAGQNNKFGYFDTSSRYVVKVVATKFSTYIVSIKKSQQTSKLLQGVPINLYLNKTKTVQFTNIQSQKQLQILIQNLNYNTDTDNTISIIATKKNHDNAYDPSPVDNIILNSAYSQGIYNIQLYSQKADYQLKITSLRPTNISIILAKFTLTHLIATRTVMMNNPAIFQITSPGDAIMVQIFPCQGQISLIASTNYTKLFSNDQNDVIRMQHTNYGGHYVVSSSNQVNGQFFVQTKQIGNINKQFQYLISYYLYNAASGQKMPYKIYGIQSNYIQPSYKPGVIQFKINKIYRKDIAKTTGQATYTLYISNSSQSISKMTKCSIGTVYKVVKIFSNEVVALQSNTQTVTFNLKLQDLKQAIGNSSYYFVGAQASFTWDNLKRHHVNSVYFVYDIAQMLIDNSPQFKNYTKNQNVFFIVLWVVTPVVLAAFVLYFAGKYFINSIRNGPTQLIQQEEPGESQEVFGKAAEQPKPAANHNNSGLGPNAQKYTIE